MDAERRAGARLLDIAAKFHFSKSALSRHFVKHLRRETSHRIFARVREEIEAGRIQVRVKWPGEEFTGDDPAGDVYIRVSYQLPVPERVWSILEPEPEDSAG